MPFPSFPDASGNPGGEDRPAALAVRGDQIAAVGTQDALRNREAQARAARPLIARGIATIDSLEDVRREAPLRVAHVVVPTSSAIIGLPGETHRESVLIDRVGRLQLPKESIHRVAFNGRAEVRTYDDHVEIWPLDARRGVGPTPGGRE